MARISRHRPKRMGACTCIATNPSSQSAMGGLSTRSTDSGMAATMPRVACIAARSWPRNIAP